MSLCTKCDGGDYTVKGGCPACHYGEGEKRPKKRGSKQWLIQCASAVNRDGVDLPCLSVLRVFEEPDGGETYFCAHHRIAEDRYSPESVPSAARNEVRIQQNHGEQPLSHITPHQTLSFLDKSQPSPTHGENEDLYSE